MKSSPKMFRECPSLTMSAFPSLSSVNLADPSSSLLFRRNLKAGLAEAVEEIFDELRVPPLLELLTSSRREVRSERDQLARSLMRRVGLAQLPVYRSECDVREKEAS